MKTAFLQDKQIERTLYLQPTKEANKTKICKLQKCVYDLADASPFWYSQVKKNLIKLGANVSSVDSGIFYLKVNNRLVRLLACLVDDMIWGGDEMFKTNITNKSKHTFNSDVKK